MERLELAGLAQQLSAYIHQASPAAALQMTPLFRALEDTSRSQISNRMGMGVASLTSAALLSAYPTVHVEALIAAGLLTTASDKRPDLAAWHPPSAGWGVIVEAKGWTRAQVGPKQRVAAKDQALAVSGVGIPPGPPVVRAMCATLLGPRTKPAHAVRVHLHDPEPNEPTPALEGHPDELIAEYYGFFARTAVAQPQLLQTVPFDNVEYVGVQLPGTGFIGLHHELMGAISGMLLAGAGSVAFASTVRSFLARAGTGRPASDPEGGDSVGADGIAFRAAPSQ